MTQSSEIAALFAPRSGHTVCILLFGGIKIKAQTAALASPGSPSPKAVSVAAALGPPTRGLPLAVLLGVTISVLVALLLGALTTYQLHRDERRELEAREGLLAESLVPLAEQFEEATSIC